MPEFKKMGAMDKDKTVKLRAFAEPAKRDVPQARLADDKGVSVELEKKTAQLEEERGKSLELLKTIVQLRESLKQERAKTAELEAKVNRLAVVEENQLARKNALLEEEKRKSLEQMKTIEHLRESLMQEQARSAGVADRTAELEAKTKEIAALEARVKGLSAALGQISSIAAAGKAASEP
jgi:chromosome segregation ATPase